MKRVLGWRHLYGVLAAMWLAMFIFGDASGRVWDFFMGVLFGWALWDWIDGRTLRGPEE